MIELQNVTKDFGEGEGQIHAVHDISLTIEDGEIFGIIGLSGAGKSTLVRCINLLERPTSGSVIVDGKDLTKLPQKELLLIRRSIGMIFQGFNLLAQRTVLQNVCYPLEEKGVCGARYGATLRCRSRRPRQGVSLAALRRTEAARSHRPRAGNEAPLPSLRRGDERA